MLTSATGYYRYKRTRPHTPALGSFLFLSSMEEAGNELPMRVVITSKGHTLDSEVETRFSRSPFFVLVDTETGSSRAFKNPGALAEDAACVEAVKFLVDQDVQVVLTGNVGHNALVTMEDTGIEIYLGATGTVRETMENFKKRKLRQAKEPSVGFQHGLAIDTIVKP